MRIERSPGQQIGPWTLVAPLGSGGNAEVWRAVGSDGSEVALKVLRQTKPHKEPFRRFQVEADLMRALASHPGVLPLIDSSIPSRPSTSNPAWLATAVATPIRDALGAESDLSEVVRAVAEVARTLADLARHREICHRDLKPENLYRHAGRYVVGDFGLVHFPDKEALTTPGVWVGPALYLAPELRTDPNARCAPADVYALAKTLWVLATRQNYPLEGYLSRDVPQFRISTYVRDERAPVLDHLIERSTHPDPARRPSMEEFASELQAWVAAPRIPVEQIDLAELELRVSPVYREHLRVRDEREHCSRHVEELLNQCLAGLEPIAHAVAQVTQLPPSLGRHPDVSNLPEIHQYFSDPEYLTYGAAGFVFASPTAIGRGNNPIQLIGGIVIHVRKDCTLIISGALGVHHGAGDYKTIWYSSARAQCESAREAEVLATVFRELRSNLPAAILEFTEILRTRKPG